MIDTTWGVAEILVKAEYYGALPARPKSRYAAFFDTLVIQSGIPDDSCCEILVIATKLRNPVLFRGALTHSMNPWHEPNYKAHNYITAEIGDPEFPDLGDGLSQRIWGHARSIYHENHSVPFTVALQNLSKR